MILYYNNQQNLWYHTEKNKSYQLGHSNQLLYYQKNNEESLPYHVHNQKGKIGPLIGVLVHTKDDHTLVVNQEYINNLAKQLLKYHCIPVLVPIQELPSEYIKGAIFDPNNSTWIKGHFPLPDCLYNRISSRAVEKSLEFKQAVQFIKNKGIPFFNPHFLDKFDCYLHFRENNLLVNHLPETIEINDKPLLENFCKKWKTIYLKPRKKFKGKGIWILKYWHDKKLVLRDYHKKTTFHNFDHFWHYTYKQIQNNYIAQQAIQPKKINGRRFDFRVISHFQEPYYIITGVGVREAGRHNITTHIPRGGRLRSYQSVRSEYIDAKLKLLVQEVGVELSNQYGFFGEFSLDIGISKSGQLYIFEVNAKPMVFDEKDIESKRLNQLCKLFLQQTGFI